MSTMLNAQVNATASPAAQNITENTTCLILNFGSIGVERKVAKGQIKQKGVTPSGQFSALAEDDAPVQVDADTELVKVTKKLIESKEFDAIQSERRKLKKEIQKLSVPSLFKEGIYRVSFAAVKKIDDMIEEFIPKDQERVKAFLAVYKQRCDEGRAKLKGLGEIADYPPLARVEASFYVNHDWMTFATDVKLKQQVSAEFFEKAKESAEVKMTQATDAIVLMMRQELKGMVDHMVEVLTPEADGTKKRFQKTTVSKIKEFLENFKLRNVTGDAQLDMIVQSATQLLDGVDADLVKKNEAVGDQTLKGMTLVKQCLDSLVVEAGSRKIQFAPQPEVEEESLDDMFAEVQ